MKILSVNAGSSSLKFQLFEMPEGKVIVSGTFEKIGIGGSFYTVKLNGEKIRKEIEFESHKEAIEELLSALIDLKVINKYEDIEGIGHRLVHGGDKYTDSVIIDDDVLQTVEKLIPLAPLHNPANLMGVRSFMEVLPNVKNVAVFDTAFHQTMGKEEYLYAVPSDWYNTYKVRKYGFHGTSHKYISETMNEYLHENKKIINCHIGNGASICAIKDGKSIDTSMGFTPVCGVVMGSRAGDIDYGLIPYVMHSTGESLSEVMNDLNKNSGMLALSGISSDMRDVEMGMKSGNDACVTAMNIYVKRIVNYISMYNTLLEGTDIITFTAGVGENSDLVREMIIDRLNFLGIKLDKNINTGLRGEFKRISSDDSTVEVYVVPTNEELMIARDTYNLIK